ncbi:hypothetical protein H4Q26_016977 [Puccinia striiformis f. sp. tritici PST-130]|nr:hypothetical protein H4Q26_016977 [Puccinia striiformis f. sp. tritici PST-130]
MLNRLRASQINWDAHIRCLYAGSGDEQLLGSYDGIDPASVNALWAIPEDFPSDEEYVSPRPSALSPLHQFHAGRCLRGVVKLGSRINLPITRRARSTTRARRTTNNYDTSFAIPLHSTVPTVLLCPRLPWPTGTADHITTPLPASVHHHHTQRPPHHPSPPSLTLKEHVTRTHQYLSNCDEHRTANRRHPNSVLPTGKRSLCHNQTTAPTLRLAHGPPRIASQICPSLHRRHRHFLSFIGEETVKPPPSVAFTRPVTHRTRIPFSLVTPTPS